MYETHGHMSTDSLTLAVGVNCENIAAFVRLGKECSDVNFDVMLSDIHCYGIPPSGVAQTSLISCRHD